MVTDKTTKLKIACWATT